MDTLQLCLLLLSIAGIRGTNHCSKDGDGSCDEERPYTEKDLSRRDPGEVGDVQEEEMGDGTTQTVITRAIHPPIFELPNFLSDEECDYIRNKAKENLNDGKLFASGGATTSTDVRVSKTTFLNHRHDKVLKGILDRASTLTGLSQKLIHDTEDLQVGYYGVGGFYNFHYDSSLVHKATMFERPCCQHSFGDSAPEKCSMCRYATLLMYLNDVEEGGETAFPMADTSGQTMTNHYEYRDLLCENAPVVVTPGKGHAVLWYNNIVDPEHGWLGEVDLNSYHGGCPVIKGEKWVSNLWIDAPHYNALTKRSKYVR